jgi:Membrane bound beta barrel domain (DUF5777)
MKIQKVFFVTISLMLFFLFPLFTIAQEKEHTIEGEEPEKIFQSPLLINNQTVEIVEKNEFEISLMQRFGNSVNDVDLFGLYAPANLRVGMDYGVMKGVSIGVGATAMKNIFDVNTKIALMNQNKAEGKPVSIVFFGEASRSGMSDTYFKNQDGEYNALNRLSYFSELMVARKFNEKFSLQGAVTFSYFNLIEEMYSNANVGISFLGRYKICKTASFIFDFDYPFSVSANNAAKPNIGVGFEFEGKANIFQLFVSTSNAIVNSEYRVCNQVDISKGNFLIGFNISHKWNLCNK